MFGREPLTLGARRSLVGLCGLTVGLKLADLGEVTSVLRLVTTRVDLGLFAPLRRERGPCNRNDDCSKEYDDNRCSKHLRLPFVWGEKPGSRAHSRDRSATTANVHPIIDGAQELKQGLSGNFAK